MPETVRTLSYMLQSILQDGQAAGSITPQDMREVVASIAQWAGFGETYATASAAGTNQGSATVLTSYATVVTTVASGTGVKLGTDQLVCWRVCNRGANPLLVYPPTGVSLENLSANAAITLPIRATVEIVLVSGTQAYIVGGHGAPLLSWATSPDNLGSGCLWQNGNILQVVS